MKSKVKILFKESIECDFKVDETPSWLAQDIQNKMESCYAFGMRSEAGHIIVNPENVMCIIVKGGEDE